MSRTKVESVTKTQRIEGRVAQILNARELVINIGLESGVTEGMKFAVLSESPTEIRDPETDELLDTLDREKVRVKAVEVRPKITICKTYVTTVITGGRFHGSALDTVMNVATFARELRPPTTIVETLKAEDKDILPPLSPEESYVKIKDRVIEILDD
ncbi:MAG: hypothetical protein LC794_13355 [Acidobacteria bacterium]|nr:hypothetical protein [Acidobacteriota bacterium]MCA1627658.1 hypothetical protein [Acidobacteriota bacterium]